MKLQFALLLFPLLLAGCPDTNKNRDDEMFKTVQMGHPEKLFAGADTNPDMWSQGYFKSGQTVWVDGLVSFESLGRYSTKRTNLQKANAASKNPGEGKKKGGLPPFIVSVESQSAIIFENVQLKISLKFIKVSNTETIIEMSENGKVEVKSNLIHFSMEPKRRNFTLLTYETDKGESSVSYFQFRTYPLEKVELRPNTYYKFIAGPGVYARWKKPIHLEVCGKDKNYLNEVAEIAVADWNRHLPADTKIKLSVAKRYHPFSDLNQNCLTVIDDLLMEPRSNIGKLATAYTLEDTRNLELFSSNILFFSREFAKTSQDYRSPLLRNMFIYTVTHEIGHTLGLDHQFDVQVPSIMSYEKDVLSTTAYDAAAIGELYGESSSGKYCRENHSVVCGNL